MFTGSTRLKRVSTSESVHLPLYAESSQLRRAFAGKPRFAGRTRTISRALKALARASFIDELVVAVSGSA